MRKSNTEIGVLGLWHLGSVYSACLAKLGFRLTGYDVNSKTVKELNNWQPPIEEPFLRETIQKHLNKNLLFTSDPKDAISDKKFIFVTYDVPVDDQDNIDLSPVDKAFSEIAKFVSPNSVIVVSSQVPVGYCRKALTQLRKQSPDVEIIYFPENLRLGTAFESFLKPDRVVIGSDDRESLEEFEKDFESLKCQFIKIGLESAEMVKHALNSYLALNISFSSELADLSEIFGSNMNEIVAGLKTDRRVSKYAPLNPGLGFAGGTLGRDIQTLRKLANKDGYHSPLLNAVYQVNQDRLPSLIKKLEKTSKPLKGKKVGILGLTYKPKTNTLRRSMSLELATLLNNKKALVRSYDPSIKEAVKRYDYLAISKSVEVFFKDLDLVVLMTEWEEFKSLDWEQMGKEMRSKIVFDCKNFLDKNSLEEAGFDYFGIGYSR